jgi:hypothetical protein
LNLEFREGLEKRCMHGGWRSERERERENAGRRYIKRETDIRSEREKDVKKRERTGELGREMAAT